MNEITISQGDDKDEITLTRGGKEITFTKIPDAFAVRLKQGRATDQATLASSTVRIEANVTHVGSRPSERLDVFHVNSAVQLEETMDKLRRAPNSDVVTHVYAMDDLLTAGVIPTGTLTLQFKHNVPKERCEEILVEFGLEILADLDFIRDGYTVGLTNASTENPLKIAKKLQAMDEIEAAEPDISVPVSYEYTPADPLYQQQWHLNNKGHLIGLKAGADVKAEAAWAITRGKREIKICVIDDGFDLNHPEFNLPDKIVAPRDFGENDFYPAPVLINNNHGTACAGVALAEENGEGVVGLAPKCSLMPLRMSDVSDNAIVAYFQYAIDLGADVISCSWSARPWNFPLSIKMSGIIHKAATQGRNGKGCVILFAAGNQERPLDGVKDGQISHQGFALHPDVLAVGASNSKDEHAKYSNDGPALALCAPSSGQGGRGIVTTDRQGAYGYTSGNYTYTFGGTSSATPLAAGLAALILSIHPDLTANQVKEIMMETADKIDPQNGRYINGHSPLYGHGRINAFRAVQQAKVIKDAASSPDETIPPGENIQTPDNDDLEVKLKVLDVSLSDLGTGLIMVNTQFQITDGDKLAESQIYYRNDIRIVNLESHETTLVASGEAPLQMQQTTYFSRQTFPVPDIGRYQPESILVLMSSSGEKIACVQSPTPKTLRITPVP